MADIRIRKGKTGKGAPLVVQPPLPTPTPGLGNPIFDSNATVYAEAKRQLKLIAEELNTKTRNGRQQNLLHVLRGILDADGRGIVIRAADREEFLAADEATVPQAEKLLAELEKAGYLDITMRCQKDHDYRASRKAWDTWNGVRLHEGIVPYEPGYNEENYLVPFDAQTYLDRVPSGNPQDLPVSFSGFHLVPCREGTIGVVLRPAYSSRDDRATLLDLRDHEIQPADYRTAYHQRLYRYLRLPALGDKLDALIAEVPGRCDDLVPRCTLESRPSATRLSSSVIFQDTRGQHYRVPEEFLLYLYNNYFGEDLDIRVSSKPTGVGSYRDYHRDTFLIVVRRTGSKHPLLLYSFEQIRENLATIT